MKKMIFEPQAKLLWHGDRVKDWVDSGMTKPILVEISPTGYCNANCPWCFFKNKQSDKEINPKLMFKILNEIACEGVRAVNWSGGGEPTIHPEFRHFVSFANSKKLKQGLFTNGFREISNQELFEWIRISLTDEGFDRIIKPKVPFGICVNQIESYSYVYLNNMCLKAKKFGASYFQVRPALVGTHLSQPKLSIPYFLKEHRTESFGIYITEYKYVEAVKPKKYEECYGYHFCPSIDWNGNLSACLYLTHDKDYILGNLHQKNFKDIWKNKPDHVQVSSKCQNCCKNHEINKILSDVRQIESVDFL